MKAWKAMVSEHNMVVPFPYPDVSKEPPSSEQLESVLLRFSQQHRFPIDTDDKPFVHSTKWALKPSETISIRHA